jgi:hypothetical protein
MNTEGNAVKRALVTVVVLLVASGCTTQQAYYSTQTWQRNECNKLIDQNERDRCIGRTSLTFEDYKRQTEDGRKP